MCRIRVDIDELISKISAMREDDYATVELEVESDGYVQLLNVRAVSFEDDSPVDYGQLNEISDEVM